MTRITPPIRPVQVPVYKIDAAEVEAAWLAFATIKRAISDDPKLIQNPYFMALHDTAYARFALNFEAM